MLRSEFETLTGIHPDSILYTCIEREYERRENGTDVWDNKAQFCAAYQADEDGLAERIQRTANGCILQMEEERDAAMKRVRALEAQLEELDKNHECTAEVIRKAHMLDALRDMARDEFGRRDLGTALAAFDYLLYREGGSI